MSINASMVEKSCVFTNDKASITSDKREIKRCEAGYSNASSSVHFVEMKTNQRSTTKEEYTARTKLGSNKDRREMIALLRAKRTQIRATNKARLVARTLEKDTQISGAILIMRHSQ